MWEDGSALDYTNWDQNETIVNEQQPINEDMGEMCVFTQSSDLRWKQSRCTGYTQTNYYICHTKKVLITSSTPVSMPFISPTSVSPTSVSTVSSKSSSEAPSSGKQAGILIEVIVMV
jgi:hypothetical protein